MSAGIYLKKKLEKPEKLISPLELNSTKLPFRKL